MKKFIFFLAFASIVSGQAMRAVVDRQVMREQLEKVVDGILSEAAPKNILEKGVSQEERDVWNALVVDLDEYIKQSQPKKLSRFNKVFFTDALSNLNQLSEQLFRTIELINTTYFAQGKFPDAQGIKVIQQHISSLYGPLQTVIDFRKKSAPKSLDTDVAEKIKEDISLFYMNLKVMYEKTIKDFQFLQEKIGLA